MNKPVYILCIEASTKNCSVSVFENEENLCLCEETTIDYSHAEKLHFFIQWALEGAEIHINQLSAIAVGKGPGSYTGLRIATATAKGLCYALKIPLLSINSLYLLAKEVRPLENTDYIVPIIDARRMEVYTAMYDLSLQRITPTEAKIIEPTSYDSYKNKKITFIGNAAQKCKEVLAHKNFNFLFKDPSSSKMGEKALEKYKKKQFEALAYFEPFYLKDFMIKKSLKNQ